MNYLKKGAIILLSQICFANSYGQIPVWKMQRVQLQSRWAKDVSPSATLKEYPRPQVVRSNWVNLNGLWDYAITTKETIIPSKFEGQILVPYPLESALSGVKKSLSSEQNLWYKRSISFAPKAGTKTLLHFGAVDYEATVFLNGKEVGKHTGGYTGFTFDITSALKQGNNELVVKVFDPIDKGIGPHGKQVLKPENIYYTPSSGIWQTVWMEEVPETYIEGLIITPDIDKGILNLVVKGKGKPKVTVPGCSGCGILKQLQDDNRTNITVKIPNAKLWSPGSPYLYDLEVTMGSDKVKSYFGMRKISVGKDEKGVDRIMLNNKPYFNLGTLDQGFWPEGLYTAPTDEALVFDIKAIKSMGFNTIRKHIKVEPARWYYHADKIGMLVWQDMVNPNQGLPEGAKSAFEAQAKETVEQLHNYPSITTWVLFNEKWGQYDQERLTKWLKETDPSRLVNGHSGEYLYVNQQLRSPSPNAYVGADMTDVHSYPDPMISEKQFGKARVCGEFGGIGVAVPGHQWNDITGWGYIQVLPSELDKKYTGMIISLKELKQQGLSGSIYTQPFDVEGEENGLMTYDRDVIKIPIKRLREIHSQLIDLEANNYKIDSSFEIAKQIDPNDNDEKYPKLLSEFEKGKMDSVFLRRLMLMTIRKKDDMNLQKVSDSYFLQLNSPLESGNLVLAQKALRNTESKTFNYLFSIYSQTTDSLVKQELKDLLRGVIKRSIVADLQNNSAQDVDQLENKYLTNFDKLGEGVVLENIAIHHYLKKDVPKFIATKGKILSKYPDLIDNNTLNNDSWFVFENTDGKIELGKALEWANQIITIEPQNPAFIDTYSNLLYKVGRRNEAIQWQEKAVTLDPDNMPIKQNLEKMKKNIPTWGVRQ